MPVITLIEVESSQIHAIGYDAENQRLGIRFKNCRGEPTSFYQYENVSQADFDAFRNAESKGKYFGQHIKPFADKYPYTKIAA